MAWLTLALCFHMIMGCWLVILARDLGVSDGAWRTGVVREDIRGQANGG